MPYVREAAWSQDALDHTGHVDIDQRTRLAVLEKQYGIADVLAHGWHLCQFLLGPWESAAMFVGIPGKRAE